MKSKILKIVNWSNFPSAFIYLYFEIEYKNGDIYKHFSTMHVLKSGDNSITNFLKQLEELRTTKNIEELIQIDFDIPEFKLKEK